MRKQTTNRSQTSNVFWDNLEEVLRDKVRQFIQDILEEVMELLAIWASGARFRTSIPMQWSSAAGTIRS